MKLNSTRQITWTLDSSIPRVTGLQVHFGKGPQPIQIAVAESSGEVTRAQLKTLFAERKGTLNTLIVVVIHGDQASLFGPDADTEVMKQKASTAEAILNSILDQPNELLAYQRATSIWRSKQTTDLVGFTNNGLFASHYIRSSVNHHPKWTSAQEASIKIQNLRDQALITALGFEITSSPSNTLVLKAKGQEHRAVAILLDQSESFDSKSTRLQASPVEWSLAIAAEQGAPWVIAIKDSQIRLYPAKDGVGVGQKSQAETYFEIDLLTIEDDKTGLLNLIFSAEALAEGGTADELLANSRKFASELGVRLRERVYESVVPMLSTEVANQLRSKGHELDSKGLQLSYELTLRILFRLLFQAYAEDRGLLPSGRNENFDKNSMKHWAQYLLEREVDAPYGDAATIWYDLIQVWDAIDQGNPDMQIPAYNGGLFGSNPDLHPEGAIIRTLAIPDRVLAPALRALVIDDNTEDGVAGAVDFRSLSVREFGTIYEGLLESSLSVADQDLTVDSKGAWVPAKPGDHILAKATEVYFHSASGERKATGSYYTPSFIVDHLVERSVEPALNDHLARVKALIDAGDQAAAYRAFFDFRVADLAMGSAHFLVAAIDKIETVMRSFLLKPGHEVDGVSAELMRLEAAAKEALGKDEAAYAEIERAGLLRRQIARRCVYGLDINPMAVELSRLAIWIHTFVPGLPMSSLDHNLVCGNSLTGVASLDEGLAALFHKGKVSGDDFFYSLAFDSLNAARELLDNVALSDEADKRQTKDAMKGSQAAREAALRAKVIFDLAVASRNDAVSTKMVVTEEDLFALHSQQQVQDLLSDLNPAHMPYLFPEVFLREQPGFDVILGNPPFEAPHLKEDRWLAVRRPGLMGLTGPKREAEIANIKISAPWLMVELEQERARVEKIRKSIVSRKLPGLGSGHLDLYQVFAWSFLGLTRDFGVFGVVLPRSAFISSALEKWRKELATRGAFRSIVVATNKDKWLFDGVHSQYTFALSVFEKGSADSWAVSGPFSSPTEFFNSRDMHIEIDPKELVATSPTLVLPNIGRQDEADLLLKMGNKTKLSKFLADSGLKPARGDDKKYIKRSEISGARNVIRVYGGKTFQILNANFGQPEAWATVDDLRASYFSTISSSSKRQGSAYATRAWTLDFLPFDEARLALRWISRSTDSRTLIPAILPAGRPTDDSASVFIASKTANYETAFLAGLLASRIMDWYARKFVELNVTFEVLSCLTVPESATPLGQEIAKYAVLTSLRSNPELVSQFDEVLALEGVPESILGATSEYSDAYLDALVALAFGLTPSELRTVFSTFHLGWDYESHLDEVKRHMVNLGARQSE